MLTSIYSHLKLDSFDSLLDRLSSHSCTVIIRIQVASSGCWKSLPSMKHVRLLRSCIFSHKLVHLLLDVGLSVSHRLDCVTCAIIFSVNMINIIENGLFSLQNYCTLLITLIILFKVQLLESNGLVILLFILCVLLCVGY
jgi:hypothetical protein